MTVQAAAVSRALAGPGIEATRRRERPAGDMAEAPQLARRLVSVERVGLGYATTVGNIELRFDHVRGVREITGQLIARNRSVDGDGTFFCGNWNASSPTQRTSTAKELGRTGGLDADAWRGILESFAISVLAEHRRAPDAVDLRTLPPRTAARTLIGPMFPFGAITTLMGKEGEGKSTFVRGTAVSLASGREFVPGWRPVATGRVLILDYESDQDEWKEGIDAIAAGLNVEPPAIDYMACAWRGGLYDHIEEIAAKVERLRPTLVVVDSAELAAGVGTESETFEARTQRLYSALRLLKTTALVVDHLPATEREVSGPASKPYGSVFKMAWSRQVWELKREKAPSPDRSELLLINSKYNAGPKSQPIGLAFNYQPGKLSVERTDVVAPELQGSLPVHERMTRLLRGGALTVPAIAQELDKSDGYVRQLVHRYKDRFVTLPERPIRIGLAGHV